MLIDDQQIVDDGIFEVEVDGVKHTRTTVSRMPIVGVYRARFNTMIGRRDYDRYPVLGNKSAVVMPNNEPSSFGDFCSYGVCDDVSDIFEQCPEIADDPTRSFIITMVEINKCDQEPEDGWRWHKWGDYIGKQTPTTEYLYDEPLIETVYCYHIYEKKQP